MTGDDITSLQALVHDDRITIKPADKGGAVVIMDTTQYEGEIIRQLRDINVYKKLTCDPKFQIKRRIQNIVDKALQSLATEEICEEIIHVSSEMGGEVMLHVEQTEIRDITWMTDRDKNIFAGTEPGKPVVIIRSPFYNGRLKVTADGSLIITNLTREDRGIYKASVLKQTSGQCAQFYNLTLYEEQVSFFRTSSTTSTSPIMNSSRSSKRALAWIPIIMCVSATAALLLLLVVAILVSTFQQMNDRRRNGASQNEDETLYTNLDIKSLQKVPPARYVKEQNTVTYSLVKVATKMKTNV
ncbi:uncharacterized protein LOC142665018 [Rhinoderma darwinii]|uniref:uncharacterized protein LOC142665018 n=1 Tax=Rhinoderma darwinii TaxID=43563 RepID=UPI003F66FEA7